MLSKTTEVLPLTSIDNVRQGRYHRKISSRREGSIHRAGEEFSSKVVQLGRYGGIAAGNYTSQT